MRLNKFILQLYQTYKNLQQKAQDELLIPPLIISISEYNPLAGRSYINLPKELDNPRKGLINIQNIDDNEYLKWCIGQIFKSCKSSPKSKKNLSALAFQVMRIRKNI